MRLAIGGAVLVALSCSCEEKPAAKPAAPSAALAPAASAAPPVVSAKPEAAPAKVAASGRWTGSYQAQHYQIESPKGEGAREWAADDGGAHAGKGTVSLIVSETGQISGSASGPLGEHRLVGEVDGEQFRVRFAPTQPGDRAFGGFVILTRDGQSMKGRLQAATGDSRTVRDASISVSRAEPSPAPSAAPSPSG